jgi:hypothetical protein
MASVVQDTSMGEPYIVVSTLLTIIYAEIWLLYFFSSSTGHKILRVKISLLFDVCKLQSMS